MKRNPSSPLGTGKHPEKRAHQGDRDDDDRLLFSQIVLSHETGISPQRVRKILAGVTPDKTTERGKYFTLRTFSKSLEAYAQPASEKTLNDERLRLTTAQADKQELEVMVAEGKLVPVEQIGNAFANVMSELKSAMMNLPPKLAPVVFAAETAREVEERAKELMYAALFNASENIDRLADRIESVDASSEADDR